MTNLSARLFAVAFSGLILGISAAGTPIRADGLATVAAGPAASRGGGDAWGFVSPRVEPELKSRLAADVVRFAGGARLRAPVATPCARLSLAVSV